MAAYARQAKDQDLILWATEIKVRAERKCGAMLAESAEHGERATPGVNQHTRSSNDTTTSPTLKQIGITRDQSSRYQQLASMSDEHFEAAVATAKDTAGQNHHQARGIGFPADGPPPVGAAAGLANTWKASPMREESL